jgi:adenylate cyclase
MSDLRGFTALTSQYPIDRLAPFLAMYFRRMTDIIGNHGGAIDKFMGDSIFALFTDDQTQSNRSELALLSCAIDMQVAMNAINEYGYTLGLPSIYMGIGLNVGDVVTGTLGSGIYLEQTVLGDPVNLVARLAGFALRGQVLMSEAVYDAGKDSIIAGSSINVMIKGRKQSVQVRELQGLTWPMQMAIPVRENRKGPRVEVILPITCHPIEDQRVRQQAIKADIIDLSYGGMRILTPQRHDPLDEIKIVIPFGMGPNNTNGDVYAKVLTCANEEDGSYCLSTEFSYLEEFTRRSIRSLVDHLA